MKPPLHCPPRGLAISASHHLIESRMDTLLRRLLCCFGARCRRGQGQPRQRHDGGHSGVRGGRDDDDDAKKSFLRRAARPPGAAARFSRSADVERLEAPRPRRRRWPRRMNRVFARSPLTGAATTAIEPRPLTDAAAVTAVQAEEGEEFSMENAAATTIQAHFRGHLARQAFRALRSLVKLQAFARGAYVRKQATVAIRCMKVLVRLQVRVRSRQLLLPARPRHGR